MGARPARLLGAQPAQAQLKIAALETLDPRELQKRANREYGLDRYESVDYRLVEEAGGRVSDFSNDKLYIVMSYQL